MPTVNEKLHRFRDKSENANIYARKYMPEYERAEVSMLKHQQAMLKKSLFNEKEPCKKYFLRPNVSNME